ncbi:MAG: helix-turn-helix domain-containing protein [Candidatus Gastranaerophilaceae bacterium]
MDYQLLGKNIRKYRLQLGMRQDDLAEKVGCSNSHIGQIEHARGVPSLEVVVNIANALGVTVDQLLMDSLDCPEIVFLRDIEKRVQDLPVAAKLIACEMLQDLMEIIEKVRG